MYFVSKLLYYLIVQYCNKVTHIILLTYKITALRKIKNKNKNNINFKLITIINIKT